MKINSLVVFGLTMAVLGCVSTGLASLMPTLPATPLVGGWTTVPESAVDPDRDCAEAVVKNAIIEINLGACQDGLKTIQVKKQVTVGVNYEFVLANLPRNCDSIGGPELCTGSVNVYKGIATLIPLSVSCMSPSNVMLIN